MNLHFIALDQDNWKTCVELWTDDDVFVASNVYRIAEGQFYPKAMSRAICVGDEMVGYTMFEQNEEDTEV